MDAPAITPALRAAAPDLSRQFGVILAGLRAVVAAGLLRHPGLVLAIAPLWNRLGRSIARFDRLMLRIAAGCLPPPRAARTRVRGAAAPAAVKSPIPTARGWLVHVLCHHAAACGSQLQFLLAQPGMVELLAVAPAAGRIFRPLCRMLGLPDPAPRPKRAPKPKPPRARARSRPLPPSGDLGGKAGGGGKGLSNAVSAISYYASLPFPPRREPRAAPPPAPAEDGFPWPWLLPPEPESS